MSIERPAVGLCGLGQMGLAIAERMATSYDVHAYDPDDERQRLAGEIDGVRVVDALGDLVERDVVLLSLPTPAVSLAVCRELADVLAAGSLVIETSTTLPRDVRECAALLDERDIALIDAAVMAGVGQMRGGTATLLVGGDPRHIAAADRVLDVLGAEQHRFGALGSGMAAKVVNNGVAHAVMVVLTEAYAMADAQDIDLARITTMLRSPDGGLVRPLTHRIDERIAAAAYDGGMPLDAARKDSVLALQMAQDSQVPLFATQAAHTVYDLAAATGLGRLDYSSLATLWESWTGRSLAYRAKDER